MANDITVVSTVPTLVALWPDTALEAVRLLIMGGEACPPELASRLQQPGREVWNGKVWAARPATVVADTEDLIAAYVSAGTTWKPRRLPPKRTTCSAEPRAYSFAFFASLDLAEARLTNFTFSKGRIRE